MVALKDAFFYSQLVIVEELLEEASLGVLIELGANEAAAAVLGARLALSVDLNFLLESLAGVPVPGSLPKVGIREPAAN